ncbi:hypothetical protein Plhal710r2_c012g0053231 [Plasmopara halstedii]
MFDASHILINQDKWKANQAWTAVTTTGLITNVATNCLSLLRVPDSIDLIQLSPKCVSVGIFCVTTRCNGTETWRNSKK